jgi:hypothetical protein
MARSETHLEGGVVLGAVTQAGVKPYGMEGVPWAFVYDGTITDVDALGAILGSAWLVQGALKTAGDLIFTHVLTHLAGVGNGLSSDAAMVHAAHGLRGARALGTFAFVCSDGRTVYAYALGRGLALTRSGAALVVGSPELVPREGIVETISSGALVLLSHELTRPWSFLVTPDR